MPLKEVASSPTDTKKLFVRIQIKVCSTDFYKRFVPFLHNTKTTTIRTTIIGTPIIKAKGTSKYWISHFHVMLEGCVTVNSTPLAFPEAGTLPVPDQPEHRYWVTIDPSTGVSTEACTGVPASNHPVVGVGEPWGDCTVSIYWWVQEAVSFTGLNIVAVIWRLLLV
jgi:hypothetical protein